MSDEKKNTVRVFNTLTGMYEDVEVSEEVYLELIRDRWRNEKRVVFHDELFFASKWHCKHALFC